MHAASRDGKIAESFRQMCKRNNLESQEVPLMNGHGFVVKLHEDSVHGKAGQYLPLVAGETAAVKMQPTDTYAKAEAMLIEADSEITDAKQGKGPLAEVVELMKMEAPAAEEHFNRWKELKASLPAGYKLDSTAIQVIQTTIAEVIAVLDEADRNSEGGVSTYGERLMLSSMALRLSEFMNAKEAMETSAATMSMALQQDFASQLLGAVARDPLNTGTEQKDAIKGLGEWLKKKKNK